MSKTHLLTAAGIVLWCLCFGLVELPTADADDPRFTAADALLAAQACVHEATWAGGLDGTGDCGGIIAVVESRRRTGETFSQALRFHTMTRFAAGTTDRSWALHLPLGVMHTNPPGWPFQTHASHHDAQWHSVYRRVVGFMQDREPLPCTPQPSRWFGRETDGNALTAALESNRWREADCNPSGDPARQTANAFLYGVDLD